MDRQLELLRSKGFGSATATRMLRRDQLAADAALVTAPNAGVPAELTTFLDPDIVPILTAVRRARAITGGREVQKGDHTTTSARFPVIENVGGTEPYDDFADGGQAGVNANWVKRDNYLFQTTRRYGDLELDVSSLAKINLAAMTQKAAATIIDTDANRFYFRGVAGLRNYGILNDPGLNAPISPAANGTGNSPLWTNKTTQQIYGDCLTLFQELVEQTGGNVGHEDPLTLGMSPAMAVRLATVNDLGISVMKMLKDYFKNLTVVTAPEYATQAGEMLQFIAPVIEAIDTVLLSFSEKFYAFAPVRETSSVKQKFRAGTYGAVIRRPAAIAAMLGV